MTLSKPGRGIGGFAAALTLILMAVLSGCSSGVAKEAGGGAASLDPIFNQADVKFAQTMIPHHQQAIEMSDMILAKSDVAPGVDKLAQQIKDTQQGQMTTMNDLLTAWNQPLIPDHSAEADEDHWKVEGVLTPEEMQALAAADSPTGQQLFLEGMIQHDKGAVSMVQSELNDGRNDDAVELAQAIKDGRTTQIKAMEGMLRRL